MESQVCSLSLNQQIYNKHNIPMFCAYVVLVNDLLMNAVREI